MKKILFILALLLITLNVNSQSIKGNSRSATLTSSVTIENRFTGEIYTVSKNDPRVLDIGKVFSEYKLYKPRGGNYNTAGEELQIASSHFYIGTGLTLGGIALGILGVTITPEIKEDGSKSYDANYLCLGVGSALSIVGIIFTIESFSHISKAGIKLDVQNKNQTGLYLNSGTSNVSLTYKF